MAGTEGAGLTKAVNGGETLVDKVNGAIFNFVSKKQKNGKAAEAVFIQRQNSSERKNGRQVPAAKGYNGGETL